MIKEHTFKLISELDKEKKTHVKVIGRIIDVPREKIYLIDDGTKAIHVVALEAITKGELKRGEVVRVFGELRTNEKGEPFINANIIQKMREESYKLFLKYFALRDKKQKSNDN